MVVHPLIPGFDVSRILTFAGTTEVDASPYHRLLIHCGVASSVKGWCGGLADHRRRTSDVFDLIPSGYSSIWEDEDDGEIIRIRFSPGMLESIAHASQSNDVALDPKLGLRDTGVATIALTLASTITDPHDKLDVLYLESLSTALATRLLQVGRPMALTRPLVLLSARERSKIVDFVNSNISENLSLAQSASVMSMSVSLFTKRFRNTFGTSFHRFVIAQRVENAVRLLQEGKLSPSEIAFASGFAHQSHMAVSMRRQLGITPRFFKAER